MAGLRKEMKMQTISDNNSSAIREIFGTDKALIGMIHCLPFPGAPRYRGAAMDTIYDAAMRDAEALIDGGMHGLIIENHGDIPFSKPDDIGPETSAFMSVVTDRIGRATGIPIGINVLANAPIPAFATAMAGNAKFIRVNQWANAYVANEGFMEGRAAEAMRYRSLLRAEHIKVFADSHVKHGADAITLLVGSGVTKENIVEILKRTNGVIVASSLKEGGVWWNPVELSRVKAFVEAARPGLGA
jgi:predicted TIM-barrel enzyme